MVYLDLEQRTHRLLVPILVCLVKMLAGCAGDEPNLEARVGARGPILVSADSVLLEESEVFYLGNPFSLLVDPDDGSFVISDFFAGPRGSLRPGRRPSHIVRTTGRRSG